MTDHFHISAESFVLFVAMLILANALLRFIAMHTADTKFGQALSIVA